MEAIEYRYRYQARHTVFLLVHDKSGHHVADGLYHGPISDFGFKLPVKWEEDVDHTSFEFTSDSLIIPKGFRVVVWPANEKEEKETEKDDVSSLRSFEDIQSWMDVEALTYDGYDAMWAKMWERLEDKLNGNN